MRNTKRITDILLVLAIAVSIILCIHAKISLDYNQHQYEKIAVRFFIALLGALIIFWRLPVLSLNNLIKNIYKYILVLFFLLVVFSPIISQYDHAAKYAKYIANTISSKYHTKVEKLYALIKYFPSEFEKFAVKRFNLPHAYINLESLVKIYLLKISPATTIALGKNGFYFEGMGAREVEEGIVKNFDDIADYMGLIPFSDSELRKWKRTLEERKYWLKERGSDFVFVLAPTKAFVYSEYLPSSLQKSFINKRLSRYYQLSDYVKKNVDVNFIDVLPALLQAKKKRDYPLLFYKTDFHWNFYGAFIAYQDILERMSGMFPDYKLPRPNFSDFSMSVDTHWAHHRFIDMIGLPVSLQKNEHYITLIPKKGTRWDTAEDIPEKGIYDFFPPERKITGPDGDFMNIRLIKNPGASIPSILLLGDSFLEKCVYFFSGDAREVMNYRTIVNFPAKIFAFKAPSIVIQEILNMYILMPPPSNPPQFAEAYRKGKYNEGKDLFSVVFKKGDENISQKPISIDIPKVVNDVSFEERIFKIDIYSPSSQKVKLTIVGDKSINETEYNLIFGTNQIYLECPHQAINNVILENGVGRLDSRWKPLSINIRGFK